MGNFLLFCSGIPWGEGPRGFLDVDMKLFKDFFEERFFEKDRVRMNRWLNWYTIVGLQVLVFVVAVFRLDGGCHTPDTPTYIAAAEAFGRGELDLVRTPGTSFFLWLCHLLSGPYSLYMFSVVQEVLWLITVVMVWDMCRMVSRSRVFRVFVTGIYVLYEVITYTPYTVFIGSDLLGYVTAVIFLWLSLPPLVGDDRGLLKRAVWMVLTVFAAIAIRPASLFMLPILVVYWIVVLCMMKRKAVSGAVAALTGTVLIICALVGYRNAIERKFGFPGLTMVSYANNYVGARYYGLFRTEYIKDDVLKAQVDSFYAENPKLTWVHRGWVEIQKFAAYDSTYVLMNDAVNRSLTNDYIQTSKMLFKRMEESANEPIVELGLPTGLARTLLIFTPRMGVIYLFLLLFFPMLFVVRQIRFSSGDAGGAGSREGRMAGNLAVWIFLWGYAVCNIAEVLIGAYAEYGRLSFGCYPALLIMLAPFFEDGRPR